VSSNLTAPTIKPVGPVAVEAAPNLTLRMSQKRQPEIRSKHSVLIPRPERKKAAEIVSGLSGKIRA